MRLGFPLACWYAIPMKAIAIREPGGPEVLELREWPRPELGPGQLRIRVRAAGVNAADLLQRKGFYPPPAGESLLPGLEVAGTVEELGPQASGFAVGDRVMALLGGGGYAEEVAVPSGLVMRVPERLSDVEAAAVPEAFLTAFLELVLLGELRSGESVLIHSGASGVGTAAIQLARSLGARVLVTSSSERKLEACAALGAEVLINYRSEDFVARVREATGGSGANCVLDLVGAAHLMKNVQSLASDGRLLLVGLSGGAKAELDLRPVLSKRLRIIGSTLRARELEDRIEITRRFVGFGLPLFDAGKLRPVLDRVFPLEKAAEAHRYLETRGNVGKVVLSLP
jgi:tumor protein p53-inducible protein 3